MKIAIIGSRDYPQLSQVTAYVYFTHDRHDAAAGPLVIVSGGAAGVDQTAEKAARTYRTTYSEKGWRAAEEVVADQP